MMRQGLAADLQPTHEHEQRVLDVRDGDQDKDESYGECPPGCAFGVLVLHTGLSLGGGASIASTTVYDGIQQFTGW